MKTKFLLPGLAMIFAIGMSFGSDKLNADPDMDYVLTENGVVPIQEVDCGEGNTQCRGRFAPDGALYDIYDDQALTIPKNGGSTIIDL